MTDDLYLVRLTEREALLARAAVLDLDLIAETGATADELEILLAKLTTAAPIGPQTRHLHQWGREGGRGELRCTGCDGPDLA